MRAVVLALTLALVASHQVNLVPEFAAGKTYVYKYEGLLLGGLPQEGLGKAGLKISSKVQISAIAQNTLLLKLLDPQLFEYAGIWPQDSFSPAAKLTSVLNAQLAIPIKFEYDQGVVGKVFAPAGVSATVLNLHRGILNILQLNLKKTQNVYELHEAGPQGVCKTHYWIREDAKTNQIAVTKSKDFTNCHKRIMKDIGLAYAETCVECQQRLKSLTGTATFNYIMKPTDTGAMVSEATLEELHQFSAFNTITGAAQMQARQTLALLEMQTTPIAPVAAEYLVRGSLQYEFATELLQTPIQLLKINNAEVQINEVLQHLAANNMDMVHDDAPLKFVQLIQLLRVAQWEHVEAVWALHKTKPVNRRWIMDALPFVGTQVALRFVKEKFQADEFTMPELTQVLLVGLHLFTANKDAIQMTANLAQHPKMKAIPVLREMIILGHGSLIAKHCAEVPTCSADLLKHVHEIAAEAISKADIPEIVLALKALGNAGHPASLKPIMKLLPGFGNAAASLPIKVQVDAILALRTIAKKEPKMVQPVALQIYMNKDLHPELRMVACIVLFETKPSVALLSTLAGDLEKEQNMHVASFAYSYIRSLRRSPAPDLMHVAAAANVAMRMLSPKLERLNYRFSKALHYSVYISPVMVGAAANIFMINDAASIIPRAIVTQARAYLAGAAADVLEVGIRTEGLQDALQKTPAADENVDRITRVKRTLKALMNWKSLPTNQPLASIFVKVLGQEIAFANIDRNFIDKVIIEQAAQLATGPRARELLKEAVKVLQSGIAVQYAKPLLAAEIRRIIPTSVGVPMELAHYTAAVAGAAINVKAAINPPLPEHPETVTLDQLMKTDFQVQAEARPSIAMQTFAVIGVNTALIQAAVMARGYVHTVVPGKVAIRADLPQRNIKLELLPVDVPDHVGVVSFETVAVARNIEELPTERVVSLAPQMPSDAAQRIIPASIKKSLCVEVPYVHIKGCLEINSHNAGFMGLNPLYYIVGQHLARLSIGRGDGPALQKLELDVLVNAEKLLKQNRIASTDNQEGYNSMEENTILVKLREILEAGLKHINSSSSASSSSSSSRSASSSRSSRSSKSSSSSRSSRMSKVNSTLALFERFRNDQVLSKHSSASSAKAIMKQFKFLGNAIPPALAVTARAVRADRVMGYQFAAYLDKPASRIQFVLASLADNDKRKICADAILQSRHKIDARVAFGAECQEYSLAVKAEAGLHDSNPGARLAFEWERVPSSLNLVTPYIKRACEYIPRIAPLAGINVDRNDKPEQEIELIMALPSQESLNIIMRIPRMTLSKLAIRLPVALPIERDGSIPALKNLDIQAIIDKWINEIRAEYST